MSTKPWRFAAKTDVGVKRARNEDAFGLDPSLGLAVIADGMGGHSGGDVAAAMTVEIFSSTVARLLGDGTDLAQLLTSAAGAANAAVFARSNEDDELHGMGSTLLAALVTEDRVATVHVGDSRIYKAIPGKLTQLTTDHSYVSILIAERGLTPEEAIRHPMRNILTMAIGSKVEVEAEYNLHELEPEARLLLCSDGLWSMLDDSAILNILFTGDDPEVIASKLIEAANNAGGNDNVTVAIALR